MTKANVIPEDIQAAVAWMDEKGYSIRSISSIVKPAITEAGKRKRGGNGKKPTEGEPAGYAGIRAFMEEIENGKSN